MVILGAIVFGLIFLVLAIIIGFKCVQQLRTDDSKMASLTVCLLYFFCAVSLGSILSYWFWNAGLEQTSRGEVQIIILDSHGDDRSVIHVRHQTDWSPKAEVIYDFTTGKYVFQTGERFLDMSCSDNKDDEAIPVVCVKWSADIDSKEKTENLLDSFDDNNFSKTELEKIMTRTAEESYFTCITTMNATSADGCMLEYFNNNLDLPHIHIVDVYERR